MHRIQTRSSHYTSSNKPASHAASSDSVAVRLSAMPDESSGIAMSADDAQKQRKNTSKIHVLSQTTWSKYQEQPEVRAADEHNHDAIPANQPSRQPEKTKRSLFVSKMIDGAMSKTVSKKKFPLVVGLASVMAVMVITATAFFLSTLNDRYSISINGQTGVILADKEEAQAVLDELKAYYDDIAHTSEIDVSSVTYEEDIQVVKVNAAASEIKSADDALNDLISGQTQTHEHIAAEGETIQEIAQKYDIPTETIIAENEELTEEDPLAENVPVTGSTPLTEGTPVRLVVVQPYVHVIVEGVCETIEEIEFATETKKDETLPLNTTKVQQQGEKGSKNVTYALVLENGVEIEKTVVEEVVTKEPVPEIVLEGTKAASQTSSAGRTPNTGNLTDDEMLQYIIKRESGGRVTAVGGNGKFLGIGQLQAHHYEMYVGMTYEQTLEQPDPYAVQLEAMLGYIGKTYGTIAAAYDHWVRYHWY